MHSDTGGDELVDGLSRPPFCGVSRWRAIGWRSPCWGVSHWLPPSAPSPRVRAVSFEIVFLSSPTTTIPILHQYATGLQLLPIYSMPSIPVSCRERSARENGKGGYVKQESVDFMPEAVTGYFYSGDFEVFCYSF